MKGSFVRNAKNQGKRPRRRNKKPNRLFVNAVPLKSESALEKEQRRSRSENLLPRKVRRKNPLDRQSARRTQSEVDGVASKKAGRLGTQITCLLSSCFPGFRIEIPFLIS